LKETVTDLAYRLVRENARAPVAKITNLTPLQYDFVSNTEDTWFTFVKDLISSADHELALDEMGRILFSPKQDIGSLSPVWTYSDDDSSILYTDITTNHDLYGIPNVIEVVYSTADNLMYSRAVNDDPNSPTSTVSRGREIVRRITDPELSGALTQAQVDDYTDRLLRSVSSVEYRITYSHGYCPVRVGDCVRINYAKAGIKNVKAKVISQSIKCEAGCKVSETAVWSVSLWRGTSHTISYNANGGDGAPESQTKGWRAVIRISDTIPTREGYEFVGWGLTEHSTEVAYAPGDNYTEDVDIQLYAIWNGGDSQ